MSKRLQVVLDEAELGDLQAIASRQGMPLSEWVRRALREARRREPQGDIDSKLRVVRAAVRRQGSYRGYRSDAGGDRARVRGAKLRVILVT